MISWINFQWKAGASASGDASIAPITVRPAGKSDEEGVSKVLKSAFAVDSGWGDVSRKLMDYLLENVGAVFATEEPSCLVAVHGSRIIGASLLDLAPEAPNHLLSGPCVLHEYRNRGVASALLGASLAHLAQSGVKTARGLTRANSITARFVYPKFSGVSQPYEGDPPKHPAP